MTPAAWQRFLPPVATGTFAVSVLAIVASAGPTLGYDFHAYEQAARRLIDGQPLYDGTIDVAGGFAIYLYPPPFALAIVPLAVVGGQAAVWIWTGLLVLAFLVGVALLPVARTIRWTIVLLAALSWPFLYSVKLGQVGPLLFLLFAAGWRWLDRPERLGSATALGTLVKLQPGLLIVWTILTRRWLAAAIAVTIIGIASVIATIVAGVGSWADYAGLLGRVASPLTTPHNFTPGAIAWQLGVALPVAATVQAIATLVAVGSVLAAARWTTASASYLVAIVASQLVSPLLWDHYAMLLLLPVAWLLQQHQWWAVLVPLATSILLIGAVPAFVYPIVFGVCLVAPIVLGRLERPSGATRLAGVTR